MAKKLLPETATPRINSVPLSAPVLATRIGNALGTTHRLEGHENVASGITVTPTNVASVAAYDGCAERITKHLHNTHKTVVAAGSSDLVRSYLCLRA